jgi:rhomboid protease GluP
MLCPRCSKLISVSARECPFCGAHRPGLYGFGPALSKAFGGRLDPVSLIPIICIAMYLLSLALDLRVALDFRNTFFGLLSPSSRALQVLGSTSSYDLAMGRWWTLLTAIYLHGGLLHIVFNVLWIRSLGPEVQAQYGPARYFVIWTIAGAAGFFLSDLWPGHRSIGASGSIFGLLAALIVYGRTVGAHTMTRQIWQWAIVLGIMGFLLPGVDNLAHIGGFAGGWITAFALRRGIGRRDGRWITLLALLLLLLTGFGFALNLTHLVSRLATLSVP